MPFRPTAFVNVNVYMERFEAMGRRIRHSGGDVLIRLLSLGSRVQRYPIFVLGNQKSGTTVVASLLAKLTGLRATLDFRFPTEVELVDVQAGRMSMETFVRRRAWHFTRDVIKEPGLTYLYEPLAKCFPEAQFVMIMRDPRDNIRSLLNRLDIPGNLDDITPEYLDGMNLIWQNILQGDVFGQKGDNYIDTLSLRWNDAARIGLNHRETIHLVRYEDFCSNKVKAIENLASTLGLSQIADISSAVDIQFQPRGKREVTWMEFFGGEHLKVIEGRCCSYMKRLGYEVMDHEPKSVL